MRRRIHRIGALAAAAAAAVAAAAVPGAATAAGWAELPAYATPHGGVAGCLRGGAPGELAVLGALGPATVATDVLTTAGDGLARSATTTLGWLGYCPAVASAPGAATLYAAPVWDPATRRWQLRAGEAGGAAAVLRSSADERIYPPAAAVAASGAAVVAWYEHRSDRRDGLEVRQLVVAARPRAGAPFGPARVVARGTAGDPVSSPALGIDAAGTATLGWEEVRRGRDELATPHVTVRIATVAADGTLDTPQTLTRTGAASGVTLAVAPDGGALAATAGDETAELYERRPGAHAFVRAELPGARASDGGIALALVTGGGAVVADAADPDLLEPGPSSVAAWTRPPGGVFSAPRQLSGSAAGTGMDSQYFYGFDGPPRRTEPPSDPLREGLATAIGGHGETLVTWVDPASARHAERSRVARGTLGDGFARTASLGGACRAASSATPLVRADGTLAVAWADNASVRRWNPLYADVLGDGRVHVAAFEAAGGSASAVAPAASGARLHATAAVTGRPALRVGQPLRLRVRCAGGPCDVRAVLSAESEIAPPDPADRRRRGAAPDDDFQRDRERLTASTTLARGETGELRFAPYPGFRVGRHGASGPRVLLTTCSPTGAVTARTRLAPRIARVAPRPIPWLRDVRLRRSGSRYRLTWRTAAPAAAASFTVYALSGRRELVRPAIELRGRGRTGFALAFSAPRPPRNVHLMLRSDEWGAVDEAVAPLGGRR